MNEKQPERRTQAERAEATRNALIAAGRDLFAARGYEDVGAEEIVKSAGLTRGALYHHFPGGKAGLLEAVYEQIEAESTERVAHVVLDSDMHSPLAAMKAGIAAFLDEWAEPDVGEPDRRDRGGGDPAAAGQTDRAPAPRRARRGSDAPGPLLRPRRPGRDHDRPARSDRRLRHAFPPLDAGLFGPLPAPLRTGLNS